MTCSRSEAGFALLVLLAAIGAGSLLLLVAVPQLSPVQTRRTAEAEAHLAETLTAVRTAHLRFGAVPADLDALAAAAGLDPNGAWRLDPFGAAQELGYVVGPNGAELLSRGRDGVLGTPDDLRVLAVGETMRRIRQRGRLRLLRAVLSQSEFRLSPTMLAFDLLGLREALRDAARAKREWLTASAAQRLALGAELSAAGLLLQTLSLLHGLVPLPTVVTGPGGLANRLGMPDDRFTDLCGGTLRLDPVLGVVAPGSDGIGGTDDDM